MCNVIRENIDVPISDCSSLGANDGIFEICHSLQQQYFQIVVGAATTKFLYERILLNS